MRYNYAIIVRRKYLNMVKTHWADLDTDGRRLERIIKICETKMKSETDDNIKLAYIDRIIKASGQKLQVTDMMYGIKMLRRLAEKSFTEEITEQKLKELKQIK